MLEPREGMAPSIPGFVLTWALVPTGRAPHTRARPVAASCRVPRIRRSLLRPVIAGGAFQPISLLPGQGNQFLPRRRDPIAKCRFRYTRAQGSEAVAWCAQGCPPPRRGGGSRGADLSQAAKREAARGGSASSAATAHAPPPEMGGGAQAAATLEDYAPVRKARAPVEGSRSSGRAPSRQRGLQQVFFYVGPVPPRVRAPSSRAPVSTTAQQAQLVRCRVRRGCRVFGDRGARRPRDVRCREGGE